MTHFLTRDQAVEDFHSMTNREAQSFRTTLWTQVVAARGNSPSGRAALSELCETYYEPVETFVRRYSGSARGSGDDARDLTHEFFAKLLEGHGLDHVERTRGRFRSYLLGAVKHFLADRQDFDRAIKRGGGQHPQSLSLGEEPAKGPAFPPDAWFDRPWALAVVERAIETLRAEAERGGDVTKFEVLKAWLVVPSGHNTAVVAARRLQLSDGAFKVAVHRLRKRFRHVVTDHIAATVNDPADVPNELNHLINALSANIDVSEAQSF